MSSPVTRTVSIVNTGLFFLAGLMALCFLATPFGYSVLGVGVVVAASALVTALRLAGGKAWRPPPSPLLGKEGPEGRWRRALVWLAWLGNVGFHCFLVYYVVVWAPRLAWTMPQWSRILTAILIIGVLATLRHPASAIRVPVALPLGLIILMCLLGWGNGEGLARCVDYLRVKEQPGVEILFPSVDQLASCSAGETFAVRRFPRKIWESPDGRRYVVTTTPSSIGAEVGGADDVYDGLFCEVSADGTGRPNCVAGTEGKAHEIQEAAPLDQLLSCGWAERAGRKTSAIYRLSRSTPLTLLGEHRMDGMLAVNGFYQPKTDEYHAFTDQADPIQSVRASDFSKLPGLPTTNSPGAIVYDADRDEGVMCGGVDGFSAFRLMPWSYRLLARENNPLVGLWMSLGCDFDRVGRRVYATIPSLGLLAVIDYDTGLVERTHFVGLAMRSVAFDAPRRRVYIADFLGGDVLAVDADSGAEIKRWFVGHYIRETLITRDGKKLLTTSNLGIGRIDLDTD